MRRILPLIMILSAGAWMAFFIGCSKKSEDKLAPPVPCDTANVSYQNQIVPILQENCYSCHGSGSSAGSGRTSSGAALADQHADLQRQPAKSGDQRAF